MGEKKQYPLVASKTTNILYQYLGEKEGDKFEFENLKTGTIGLLNETQSQQLFKIPLGLNEITLKYPNVLELMKVVKGNVIVEDNGETKQYRL